MHVDKDQLIIKLFIWEFSILNTLVTSTSTVQFVHVLKRELRYYNRERSVRACDRPTRAAQHITQHTTVNSYVRLCFRALIQFFLIIK